MAEPDEMSSELKSETARINGAKSHGPVTPEGKARSSANSRRHGLTASILLDVESDEHFQLLVADFMDQFQPQTGVETDLVEMMAIARWRLRRLLAIETHLFELEMVRRRKQINATFTGMDQEAGFHETARPVNRNLCFPFNPGFHTHSDEPIGAGSMQDKFRVEAWRCYLSHELEAHSPRRSRQEVRVFSTPPGQPKLTSS
jgi:hypothetical protein